MALFRPNSSYPESVMSRLGVGVLLLAAAVCASCSRDELPSAPQGIGATPVTVSGAFTLAAKSSSFAEPNAGFQLTVSLTNRQADAESITYGGCWGFVQLYTTSDRSGAPVYDQGANPLLACELYLRNVSLAPGDVVTLQSALTRFGSLGLPAGHYYAAVRMAPNGAETVVPAGEVDVTK